MNRNQLALLTPKQMAKADQIAIASGISEQSLIEEAGRAVTNAILRRFAARPTLVLAGPGNNGADARVVFAKLKQARWPVRLIEAAEIKPDSLQNARLIVDGLFGAGLSRPITGPMADLIQQVNEKHLPVIAIDIPSGFDGETGQCLSVGFQAALTVTFFRFKPGHFLHPARAACGELELCDISIPENVLSEIPVTTYRNAPGLWSLPQKSISAHKFDHGHALIISGPAGKTGAARLAARAALGAGAGLVTIAGPENVQAELSAHLTAIMQQRADHARDISHLLSDRRFTACLIGPGAELNAETRAKAAAALESGAKIVLDAGVLRAFKGLFVQFRNLVQMRERPVILTPHEGEFSSLFNGLINKSESKTERALEAAKLSGAIIVLKGADTIIASPDGRIAVNDNAPPFLATAGSGDVLAGIILALLAQGMEGFVAACAGVYIHGKAAQDLGPGLNAELLSQARFRTGNAENPLL